MNKEKFETHISTHWFIYLIYSIIAIFIWSYAVTLYTKDRPKEVVTVWIMAYDADQNALTLKLESSKADYLKHVRVTFEDRRGEYVTIKYQGIGVDSDIVVLPESFLENNNVASTYLMLNTDYLSSAIGDLEYYTVDYKAYGIKIFDKNDTDDGLIKYTTDDIENENYYLLIKKKSLHMGSLNNASMDGGINVLRMLLGYEPIL